MHWRFMSLAVFVGFIAARQAAALTGAASDPCALLTAAQISAAVGSIGESKEGDMPGNGKMRACSWSIPGGSLTLMVGKASDPNQTRQLLNYMFEGEGWKHVKNDSGKTSCSLFTPPAGAANSMPTTSCSAVDKGMLVIASASSKTIIPAEKVKSLVEAASARLP